MRATGFVYDSISSEEFGLIVCGGSGGLETSSPIGEINWNTVAIDHGKKYESTQVTYDSVLETTFQALKYDCKINDFVPIPFEERRKIARWLQRHDDHMLELLGEDEAYDFIQFEGRFNVSEVIINGIVYGYELHFISNRPFAIAKLAHYEINATSANFVSKKIYDMSDETGFIYPKKFKITCNSSGNLEIHNSIEDRRMIINNCSAGEVITFDDSLNISSSLPSHDIQNDFNYSFFRIANSYTDRLNILTISIPCDIVIEYYPVIKGVGL